jgi:ABC-type cobalamin transport system ATPase subunit
VAFIKGPPGCGKTRTIARLATIFSYHGYPMMIGAVTNTANMTILNAILKESYEMNFFPNIVLFISK